MAADLVDELGLKVTGSWKVGERLLIECGLRRKQYEEGVVTAISDCQCKILVHFNKWAANFDEWIVASASRLNVIDPASKRLRT